MGGGNKVVVTDLAQTSSTLVIWGVDHESGIHFCYYTGIR